MPCPRPRVSRYGSYYPKRYRTFKQQAEFALQEELPDGWVPLQGPLLVELIIWCERPRTTKLDAPKGDIDNYCKSVLDVGNGVLWADDSQILTITATKSWAPAGELGKILVVIQEVE